MRTPAAPGRRGRCCGATGSARRPAHRPRRGISPRRQTPAHCASSAPLSASSACAQNKTRIRDRSVHDAATHCPPSPPRKNKPPPSQQEKGGAQGKRRGDHQSSENVLDPKPEELRLTTPSQHQHETGGPSTHTAGGHARTIAPTEQNDAARSSTRKAEAARGGNQPCSRGTSWRDCKSPRPPARAPPEPEATGAAALSTRTAPLDSQQSTAAAEAAAAGPASSRAGARGLAARRPPGPGACWTRGWRTRCTARTTRAAGPTGPAHARAPPAEVRKVRTPVNSGERRARDGGGARGARAPGT